jgi:hypothetical protein
LSYEGKEKADVLNKYFCSITNLVDENKLLPDFDDKGGNIINNIIKTEIMIFNIKNHQDKLSFDFDGIFFNSVNKHKHLGIIISSDCKWTKHIDSLIQRTSKQLNVLRKLKFILKREYLENICLLSLDQFWNIHLRYGLTAGKTNYNWKRLVLLQG